jgi:hypothetical protein
MLPFADEIVEKRLVCAVLAKNFVMPGGALGRRLSANKALQPTAAVVEARLRSPQRENK